MRIPRIQTIVLLLVVGVVPGSILNVTRRASAQDTLADALRNAIPDSGGSNAPANLVSPPTVSPPPMSPAPVVDRPDQSQGDLLATPNADQTALPNTPLRDGAQQTPELVPLAEADLADIQRSLASRVSAGAARGALATAPSMIGDTTSGSCGVVRFDGGLPVVSVQHPTFACSRLNLSENNSAIPRDRIYANYRHFHNASTVSVFADFDDGGQGDQNIDRVTFGLERKIFDRSSIEIRVPVNRQLSSDLSFSQLTGPAVGASPIVDLPLDDLDTSLGNIAIILKNVIFETDSFVLSGGLALNLPTAPDVKLSGFIDDERFSIQDPNGVLPDRRTSIDFFFESTIANRLINMSPFAAFATEFGNGWFAQGFAQVDLPISPLNGSIDSQLRLRSFNITLPRVTESGDIDVQVLGRFSLGLGKFVYRSRRRSVAIVAELHHTTTLEDENLTEISVLPGVGTLIPPTTVQIGNIANRTDVLNAVVGVPIQFGSTRIVNGIAAPLRDAPDRGFDFEYSLSVSRHF